VFGPGAPFVEATLQHGPNLLASLLAAVYLLRPPDDRLHRLFDDLTVPVEGLRTRVLVKLLVGEAHEGDEQRG
jgi:hypothetical protein